jgi:hypothetical protein
VNFHSPDLSDWEKHLRPGKHVLAAGSLIIGAILMPASAILGLAVGAIGFWVSGLDGKILRQFQAEGPAELERLKADFLEFFEECQSQ